MRFSHEEKQKAMQLAKELGLEVTFDNPVPGIFVGGSDTPYQFEEVFPDIFTRYFGDEVDVQPLQLNFAFKINRRAISIPDNSGTTFFIEQIKEAEAA